MSVDYNIFTSSLGKKLKSKILIISHRRKLFIFDLITKNLLESTFKQSSENLRPKNKIKNFPKIFRKFQSPWKSPLRGKLFKFIFSQISFQESMSQLISDYSTPKSEKSPNGKNFHFWLFRKNFFGRALCNKFPTI